MKMDTKEALIDIEGLSMAESSHLENVSPTEMGALNTVEKDQSLMSRCPKTLTRTSSSLMKPHVGVGR
jgi:hypothetical protein